MTREMEAARWAQEMANDLPEELRVAGFQELLRYALQMDSDQRHERATENPKSIEAKAATSTPAWILEEKERLPPDHRIREAGTEAQKVGWAVLGLVAEGKEAVNKEISKYIRMNLGISPPSREAINRGLRNLIPKYLAREKVSNGRGYMYRPQPLINQLFEDIRDNAA